MLGLKLNHVSKSGPRCYVALTLKYQFICPFGTKDLDRYWFMAYPVACLGQAIT